MNIKIPSITTAKKILATAKPPRGATHFRFTEGRRKPIVDVIKNIDLLAGCKGVLEFGKQKGRTDHIDWFVSTASAEPAKGQAEKNAPAQQAAPQPTPAPAAPAEQPPAPATGRPKGAKLNRILGFSACAVAKSLGKAGVKHEEADRIFRAHGIKMPKASLSVQLGFGRRPSTWERHGKPADVTDAQITELRTGTMA